MAIAGRTINADSHIESYRIHQALKEIKATYGCNVVVKPKDLLKFGQNTVVGASQTTVMTLPSGELKETYVNDNLINRLVSDDIGDTQQIRVEGHILSGGNLLFVVQTVSLMGQTPVTLPTPLARCTRMENINAVDLLGNVYAFQSTSGVSGGTPTDGTKVHAIIPAGSNKTRKCATSISAYDFFLISTIDASLNKKTAANADIFLQSRQLGSVFTSKLEFSVGTEGSSNSIFEGIDPIIIIPNNSDVELLATASTTGVSVSGSINGYLAYIID